MNIKFLIIAKNLEQYLNFAAVNIHYLITNGNANPKDIYVASGKYLYNSDTKKHIILNESVSHSIIKKFGCNFINLTDKMPQNHFGLMDLLLSSNADSVLYLDSYTIYNKKENLYELVCENTNEFFLRQTYKADCFNIFQDRLEKLSNKYKLNICLKATKNENIEEYFKSEHYWVRGGVYLANKKILGTNFWNTAVLINETSSFCDEMCVMIASRNQKIATFNANFEQEVSCNIEPKEILKIKKIIHYGGSLGKNKFKNYIKEMIKQLRQKTII